MTIIQGARDIAPPPTTTEELVASALLEADADAAEASRDLGQLSRELRAQAQREQITQERRAAEQTMIAGVLAGVGEAVAGGMKIAGGAWGLGRAGELPSEATEADRTAHRTQVGNEQSLLTGAGDLSKAGLGIAAAVVGRDASESKARATEAEHASASASEAAEVARDDLRGAREASERATESLRAVLAERRRAEEAATRA